MMQTMMAHEHEPGAACRRLENEDGKPWIG
jgi:hypothetical protein